MVCLLRCLQTSTLVGRSLVYGPAAHVLADELIHNAVDQSVAEIVAFAGALRGSMVDG